MGILTRASDLTVIGGTLLDYTHAGSAVFVNFATTSAPAAAKIVVTLNAQMVETVYLGPGTPHTWWGGSGASLVPGGMLSDGDRIVVTSTAPAAFRLELGAS